MASLRIPDGNVLWQGCIRKMAEDSMVRHAGTADACALMHENPLVKIAVATPAANGNAIPAISLSTSI